MCVCFILAGGFQKLLPLPPTPLNHPQGAFPSSGQMFSGGRGIFKHHPNDNICNSFFPSREVTVKVSQQTPATEHVGQLLETSYAPLSIQSKGESRPLSLCSPGGRCIDWPCLRSHGVKCFPSTTKILSCSACRNQVIIAQQFTLAQLDVLLPLPNTTSEDMQKEFATGQTTDSWQLSGCTNDEPCHHKPPSSPAHFPILTIMSSLFITWHSPGLLDYISDHPPS